MFKDYPNQLNSDCLIRNEPRWLYGPYSQGYEYDVWGNRTHIEGWGGVARWEDPTYTNNRRNGMPYDAAGNLTSVGGYTFNYDATGQQTAASTSGYSLQQYYDGDGRRAKKNDNGDTVYYLRSTVLGGQVVAELSAGGSWTRGFVYQGSGLVAVQQNGVYWMHEDPVGKSKRVTDASGNVVSGIELDPFGGDTSRNWNSSFQPKTFTSYHRDANGADDAMFRRYNRWFAAFDQPDPYDGSYNPTDPQSFNRYGYVQSDPVNFVDPSGLDGTPGDLCPGGVIGNDGKCHAGPVYTVNSRPSDPFWDQFDASYSRPTDISWMFRLQTSPPREVGPTITLDRTPQNPRTTQNNNQQHSFDECAKTAWRSFRKGYLRDSFEGALGAALIVGGIYVSLRGIPGASPAGGIGVRAAVHLGARHGIEVPLHIAQAGFLAGSSLEGLGTAAILHSIGSSNRNHSQLDAALQDCKTRFPSANHSGSFLNF